MKMKQEAPASEDAMMISITEGIDRLFNIIRPRKLLMMAIDGVAPRAKMNQQRSRRFRSAQDAAEKRAISEKIIERVRSEGGPEPPESKTIWDSNAITPGTPFMEKVANWLHFWVATKLTNDPGWKNVCFLIFFV
jgi:5'-3' exoribonuclease 2